MPLARKEPGGGIEADPARARQVDFAPRVQVGEIFGCAGGAVERFHVGFELDQVAGCETRGESEIAQQHHEQPRRVATRSRLLSERLVRCLDARFHADQVRDIVLEFRVEIREEGDRRRVRADDGREVVLEIRADRLDDQIGREFERERRLVAERKTLGRGFEEKIERVDDRELRDEIDRDAQMIRRIRNEDAREPVRLRIGLPVQKVALGLDVETVGEDRRAAMRRRPKADHLRPELDPPIVSVPRGVVEGDPNAHLATCRRRAARAYRKR